jgi:hypothetical protein
MAPTLRPTNNSQGDHHVMHGEWQIGQIDRRPSLLGSGDRWLWALNGIPAGIPKGIRLAGVTGTLKEAQAELMESWKEWMAWANLAPLTGEDRPTAEGD